MATAGIAVGYLLFAPKPTIEPTPKASPYALASFPQNDPSIRIPPELKPLAPETFAEPKAEPQPTPQVKKDRTKETVAVGLTVAALAAILIEESRNAYYATGRPCACPEDVNRAGRRCGGTSAYSRPGGAQPYCYISDVPLALIEKYRQRLSAKQ